MTQLWLTFIVGIIILIWGAAVLLHVKFLRLARKKKSAKVRAISDVIIGAFLIYVAINSVHLLS